MSFSSEHSKTTHSQPVVTGRPTQHVVGDGKKKLPGGGSKVDPKKGGRGSSKVPPSIDEFKKYGFSQKERDKIIRGWKLFNKIKAKYGLKPKPIVLKWCKFAKNWSKIQNRSGMHHSSSFGRVGASRENVAMGQGSVLGAMRAWYHSGGHLANIKAARGFGFYGFDRGAWTMLG